MRTSTLVLEVPGLLLLLVGSFLQHDRRRGHGVVAALHEGAGALALLVAAALSVSDEDARQRACRERQEDGSYLPPAEVLECVGDASAWLSKVQGFLLEGLQALVLGLVAVALGWLLARMVPGQGAAAP